MVKNGLNKFYNKNVFFTFLRHIKKKYCLTPSAFLFLTIKMGHFDTRCTRTIKKQTNLISLLSPICCEQSRYYHFLPSPQRIAPVSWCDHANGHTSFSTPVLHTHTKSTRTSAKQSASYKKKQHCWQRKVERFNQNRPPPPPPPSLVTLLQASTISREFPWCIALCTSQ